MLHRCMGAIRVPLSRPRGQRTRGASCEGEVPAIRPTGLASAPMDLKRTTLAFFLAFTIHGLDHLRRGLDVVHPSVLLGGTLQGIFALFVLATVLGGHRAAPMLAMVLGFGSAILFTSAHLLPHWSPNSDSYIDPAPGAGVTLFSWVTAVLEVGMSLLLGAVAASRRRS